MSGIQLLDKTRKIGKLLHNSHSSKVVFNDICKVMQDALQSNVLVISRKGKVLGISGKDGGAIRELSGCNVGSFLDPLLNERMLSILSTKENASLATLGFDGEEDEEFSAIVTPIEIAGERLGTLFLYRRGAKLYDRRYHSVRIRLHGGGAGNAAGCDRGECGGRPQNRSGTRRTRNLILFRTGGDQPDFSGAAWDGRHSGRKQNRGSGGYNPFRYRQRAAQI